MIAEFAMKGPDGWFSIWYRNGEFSDGDPRWDVYLDGDRENGKRFSPAEDSEGGSYIWVDSLEEGDEALVLAEAWEAIGYPDHFGIAGGGGGLDVRTRLEPDFRPSDDQG